MTAQTMTAQTVTAQTVTAQTVTARTLTVQTTTAETRTVRSGVTAQGGTAWPPDHEVAEGFVRGDERCLAAAYHRWGGLVHTLAARTLGDSKEAEDVSQQVFLAAWRGRAGYRPERGPFPGWLVGITRRKIADALSARTRRLDLIARAGAALPPVGEPAAGPETVLDRLLVTGELAKLPRVQREVLALAFYGDLTQVQIAERTGMPLGTVKSHARRGLHRMRRHLAADPGGRRAESDRPPYPMHQRRTPQ